MIVGLGNPGDKYLDTRHNVGFILLDHLAEMAGASFCGGRWKALTAKANLWGGQHLLVKPETYMNRSGQAVAAVSSYFRIQPQEIIVVHDDLDLEPGRLKMVFNRGAGGHNGIRSIIDSLGTREFIRLRVGIGRPPEKVPPSAFVLSRFSSVEMESVKNGLATMEDALKVLADKGILAAMTEINSWK